MQVSAINDDAKRETHGYRMKGLLGSNIHLVSPVPFNLDSITLLFSQLFQHGFVQQVLFTVVGLGFQ